jgi:cyclic pyranopterin phosphate synthase
MIIAPLQLAPAPARPHLVDGVGRVIDHLRLSLNEHCNLACQYCVAPDMKPEPFCIDPAYAFALVQWLATRHGVDHVRLTGGEPLLYPNLASLVRRLRTVAELKEITLTTNAQALARLAQPLRHAGLDRLNISLDSIDPARFSRIARGGRLEHTLRGIEAARDAGFTPIRINVVVQRGFNEDAIVEIAEWGLSRSCVVRFLEAMPIGPLADAVDQYLVPAAEILERLSERFELRSMPQPLGQPSTDYAARSDRVRGVIGVISSTTRPFCERCRRIRVTARGRLLNCLFDNQGVDLKRAWDGQDIDESIADRLLHESVLAKAAVGQRRQATPMIQIGG